MVRTFLALAGPPKKLPMLRMPLVLVLARRLLAAVGSARRFLDAGGVPAASEDGSVALLRNLSRLVLSRAAAAARLGALALALVKSASSSVTLVGWEGGTEGRPREGGSE